jgi:hypothetical protein
MTAPSRLERFFSGRSAVIGAPYLWLLVFFLVPFLIVLKYSVSEMGAVTVNDILTVKDGVAQLTLRGTTYVSLTQDDLYWKTYVSSIKYAAVTTVICLLIAYPFSYFMARARATVQPALLMLVMLPFWTSFLLRVYAWKGLLDEPLGALDKKLREETQIELVRIIEEVGVTCVMVTHDQEEAMTMASRIAVMSEGRILQVGAPSEIYETPATRFVADFIGNVNMMDGKLVKDEVDHVIIECADCSHYIGHGITGTEGMSLSVAVRPEKITLQRDPPADGPAPHNRVQGTIRDLSYFGSFTVYQLALASGATLKVSQSNVSRHREDQLTWGDTAWASWSDSAQVVLTQ